MNYILRWLGYTNPVIQKKFVSKRKCSYQIDPQDAWLSNLLQNKRVTPKQWMWKPIPWLCNTGISKGMRYSLNILVHMFKVSVLSTHEHQSPHRPLTCWLGDTSTWCQVQQEEGYLSLLIASNSNVLYECQRVVTVSNHSCMMTSPFSGHYMSTSPCIYLSSSRVCPWCQSSL